MPTVATESGHYYYPDGRPAYTIIGKNGVERPTTIRDVRKFKLVPSVTEVIKILPKPTLNIWEKKQVLMSALTLPRLPDEADEAYMARIMLDSNEQVKRARENGTAIHGAIERCLLGKPIEADYDPYVFAVMDVLKYRFGEDFAWHCEPEKSFASPLGFGGKVDLYSQKLGFICDFKTKQFAADTTKLAWDEHAIQLNAYKYGLGMPKATMLNCFISTSVPGLARIVDVDGDDGYYWQVFLKALELWQTLKRV